VHVRLLLGVVSDQHRALPGERECLPVDLPARRHGLQQLLSDQRPRVPAAELRPQRTQDGRCLDRNRTILLSHHYQKLILWLILEIINNT